MQLTPAREGVESFVIDSERSYLFALRTHSEIEAFSFANDRFEQIAKYSQPRNQPKIVSIAVIGKHESQTKSLVAITATGASPPPLPPSPPLSSRSLYFSDPTSPSKILESRFPAAAVSPTALWAGKSNCIDIGGGSTHKRRQGSLVVPVGPLAGVEPAFPR